MIDVQIPELPANPSWTPPTDNDLYWISMGNYMFCQVLKVCRDNGVTIRQVKESDFTSIFSAANTTIEDAMSKIDAIYGGEPA